MLFPKLCFHPNASEALELPLSCLYVPVDVKVYFKSRTNLSSLYHKQYFLITNKKILNIDEIFSIFNYLYLTAFWNTFAFENVCTSHDVGEEITQRESASYYNVNLVFFVIYYYTVRYLKKEFHKHSS